MKIDSFSRLYIHTLKDIYNAERQLLKAMPQMANAASSSKLKKAFNEHLEETKDQVQRIETLFENLDFSPTGHPCKAMQGLIEEAKEIIDDGSIPSEVKDAGLIAAAQKIEHYEIASYGTAVHFADLFGHEEGSKLLGQTLDEEKKTDKKLNKLAKSHANKKAIKGEDFQPGMPGR